MWIGDCRLLLLSPINSQGCEQISEYKLKDFSRLGSRLGSRRASLLMREGQLKVEQQLGIFREVSNDVDVVEEFTV
jgi:hypothetical protein